MRREICKKAHQIDRKDSGSTSDTYMHYCIIAQKLLEEILRRQEETEKG